MIKNFEKSNFAFFAGISICFCAAIAISMAYNAQAKSDPFNFSDLQLTSIFLSGFFGSGFFYKHDNKIIKFICSARSLMLLASFILFSAGWDIIETKTAYFRYHRVQGGEAVIHGILTISGGVMIMIIGLCWGVIEKALNK